MRTLATAHQSGPGARRGYSLAELVLVITILAVVGAIAVPRFASADAGYRARGAAHQVADAIRLAAAEARARGSTVRVRISDTSNSIKAGVVSPTAGLFTLDTTAPPHRAAISSVRLADGATALDVNAFGVYSTAAVVILSTRTASAAVVVDDISGEVRVTTVAEANETAAADRFQ